jgi:itaconate CoA-transferase
MSVYADVYRRKRTTPRKAVSRIRNGDTIVHGLTIAEPPALLNAISDRVRGDSLRDIKVYSLLPLAHASSSVLALELADRVHAYSWFVSGLTRGLVDVGLQYYVPNYFHQIPRLCREYMKIDYTVTTVSPMDNAGYFSFGTANDFTSTAARHCRKLIVEVNENMPRVFGDSLLHVSEVDAIVENTVPLLEMPPPPPKAEDEKIGQFIAEMVPDGATLQLGLGGIPNAITRYLNNHRDLGIHTEVFSPGMVDLIRSGVVNGSRKTLHPRKHVFTVAQGVKSMYDFMNDNPSMESYPVSFVNDPSVIARNDRMISINSIIEVDLTGQCNAEFLGGHQFSGTGGQLDYVRGAFNAREGKSILAFYSSAREGKISRIVPRFKAGTVVTTPRMDTHCLVTEFGVADLKGKSTRGRVQEIIAIAHPKFREELFQAAERLYLV